MKRKKFQYAVLEIAMYHVFDLERELMSYGREGWKIISVTEKHIVMERIYG